MIRLRPILYTDKDFLYDLKKAGLKEYIAQTWGSWDEEWQRNYFFENFDPNKIQIITKFDIDVGCISISSNPKEVNIDLIIIAPKYQNQGIGSFVITRVLLKTKEEIKPVMIQVLKVNVRAIKFYKSLGFETTEETETHYKMNGSL